MTVLVSVKINDGVVMAADSASSFASGMVYQHADKIANLRHGHTAMAERLNLTIRPSGQEATRPRRPQVSASDDP